MKFTPLMFNLEGKSVIIFGGGGVGERKALFFQEYADVTVVSQDFTSKLENSRAKLIKVTGLTDQDIVKFVRDSFIVVPATSDRDLNRRIMLTARREGKLVDSVDSPGDIVVPSVVKQGDIVIGISTSAKSPALTRYLRVELEKILTPSYPLMARLQSELRVRLKQEIESQPERKKILWKVLEDRTIWDALERADYEAAFELALKYLQNQGHA